MERQQQEVTVTSEYQILKAHSFICMYSTVSMLTKFDAQDFNPS